MPWVEAPADQSAGQWETGTEQAYSAAQSPGQAHISFAAILLMLILLKVFTESNLLSTDLAEIKVSALNIITVLAMAIPGIVGFKVATAKMAEAGIALPGQVELAQAI